jgi:predicted unusual protein kinase regulating ubiquinone biosynthesis (AarF/ABC1/UbiB family)
MSDSKEDKSNLAQRSMRYGRVSATMAGLGARLAADKFLGLKIDQEQHADQLTAALGNLKGPLMKVGQILATIPEALPPEYAKAFQGLQSEAPSMGWPFVKRRMRTELGPEWPAKFNKFEHEASAAASLGQVHKAELHDGQIVACKLQYPDMHSAIDADLNQLKLMFSIYARYDKTISTQHIHSELAARLYEELDYELEGQHMKLYGHMLRDEPNVHIPKVIESHSTNRLLTATWQDGHKIMNYVDSDIETRNQIALNMFKAWYVPLYHYGIIHGDPHLGNYTVRDDLSINLLDFGCVRIFPPKFVQGVITLYNALMTKNDDLAVEAYESWGFHDLSKAHIETLNIWAGFLYGPLMEDKIRPIGEVSNGVYGRETAEKVHERLRDLGGITVPREFVFMDRAALGLGSVFLHLKAEVNWYRVFNEMIDGFDMANLQTSQDDALALFDIDNKYTTEA